MSKSKTSAWVLIRWYSRRIAPETVLVAAAMVFATIATWRILIARDRTEIERSTGMAAQTVQQRLSAELALRATPLERLAHEWVLHEEVSRAEWEETAALFTSVYSGYIAIQWVDRSLHARWVAPVHADPALQDYSYAADPLLGPSLTRAKNERRTVASRTGRLPQGDDGFLLAAPIYRQGRFEGFMAGLFGTTELLHYVLSDALPAGYTMEVFDGNRRLYTHPQTPTRPPNRFHTERTINLYGEPWTLRVWPSPESLLEWYWRLPSFFLAAGLLICALVAISTQLAVTNRRRNFALERANRQLASEITDRRRAAAALQQANETLKTVIDTSPLAIACTSDEGVVSAWNTAAEALFGWSAEEVLGRPVPVITADGVELSRLARGRARQETARIEATLFAKDGRPVSAEVWVAPQRMTHSWSGSLLCMIADISERRKLQEQVLDSHRIEAVSRLAAGVAHNFNNLLAIIMGYSRLALDSLPDNDPLREEIQEVLAAADRAARLTVQLLAFGRRQVIRPEVVDLNRLVMGSRDLLQKIAGPNIEILTPLGAEVGKVRIDPEQVQHIFVTLIVNAYEAMPGGGRVVIETANVDIGGGGAKPPHVDVPSGLFVLLSVTDNGPGMDERTRQHAFEPFYSKGLGPGGLGLSSVYGIAKQNGGGAAVISAPGAGTRVEVYLPRI